MLTGIILRVFLYFRDLVFRLKWFPKKKTAALCFFSPPHACGGVVVIDSRDQIIIRLLMVLVNLPWVAGTFSGGPDVAGQLFVAMVCASWGVLGDEAC